MLRLNSRILGKQATSPTTKTTFRISQRCSLQVSTAWRPSPSNSLTNTLSCSRDYHATASLLRWSEGVRQSRPDREPYKPRKPYGRPRYKNSKDNYPDEDDNLQFDEQRYRTRDSGVGGNGGGYRHGNQDPSPDLRTIVEASRGSRDAEYTQQLHKLRREELEKRDPAIQILNTMEKPETFEDASLRPILKKALARAYPNITTMSQSQRNLLLLLQDGYSLCATGPPGSGKSFIVALWLLQIMRSIKSTTMPDGTTRTTPTNTAIVFVPTIDLLYQWENWLNDLVSAFTEPGQPAIPKETIFQAFTRLSPTQNAEEIAQLKTLQKFPSPHIIVTTPTRFMDILNDPHTKYLIDPRSLKVVVADEIDSMMTQRPAPKSLADMKKSSLIRDQYKWAKPTPFEICIERLIESREVASSMFANDETLEPLQYCFISPNLSPVLQSKISYQKQWVSRGDSHQNQLLNLGIRDFAKQFNPEKIQSNVWLPRRIKHYAMSVDITSGMMRDIPASRGDVLRRSKDEQAEIAKYVNVLKTHHDPRVEVMSNQALVVEAAQENILSNEEGSLTKFNYFAKTDDQADVKDIITDLRNDFRHTSLPRQIVVEILEFLLKRDNYPERVIVYFTPTVSRQEYIDALADIGLKAEYVRNDTLIAAGIQLGRSDLPPPQTEKTVRTKADTTIWIASPHAIRGLDLPHFTHAYIMFPTTAYQKYAQMAGRIARYPFPDELPTMPEPKGQVTTIFLEEPVGKHHFAPMVDGVIQIGSPVEALAWRRIHRMYALCGAKVDNYFGEDEPYGAMLRGVETHTAKFPDMDEELPWETGVELGTQPQQNADTESNEGYEFLPLDGESPTTEIPKLVSSHTTQETKQPNQENAEQYESDLEDSFEPIEMKHEDVSTPAQTESSTLETNTNVESSTETLEEVSTEEPSPEEETIEAETREDENDPEDSPSIYEPVELEDGAHFAPEDAPEEISPAASGETEPSAVPPELKGVGDDPLDIAEGVSEEEVKEFQEAQDQIFAAFLELSAIQDKLRKEKEAKEGPQTSETENTIDEEDLEVGEVADMDIDGVKHETVPASKNEDSK
ncbi:hypothetical protein AA313_de0202500 [Arthrobotrys entomopaga]|nr:hypothetical protein AA313_de0202500 [Arthrobotrys entomopaga]